MEDGPDRSILEIKNLLVKLHPRHPGGHKDRVRTLTRFRSYVSGATSANKQKVYIHESFFNLLRFRLHTYKNA